MQLHKHIDVKTKIKTKRQNVVHSMMVKITVCFQPIYTYIHSDSIELNEPKWKRTKSSCNLLLWPSHICTQLLFFSLRKKTPNLFIVSVGFYLSLLVVQTFRVIPFTRPKETKEKHTIFLQPHDVCARGTCALPSRMLLLYIFMCDRVVFVVMVVVCASNSYMLFVCIT